MQSINDLDSQIQTLQDKADAQAAMAQQERDKADEAEGNDDANAARAHRDAAARYDQGVLQAQSQIENAQIKVKQDQKIINELNEKKSRLIQTHEQQLREIDLEIQRASGQ